MSIETVIKTYESALNANDIETILALYRSEPVFMPQHAPALNGRDAVRAGYEHVFNTIKLNVRFEIYEIEVTGDWAWVPEQIMEKDREIGILTTAYTAKELDVDAGDHVIFMHELNGWSWCELESTGECGWIPNECLRTER